MPVVSSVELIKLVTACRMRRKGKAKELGSVERMLSVGKADTTV